MSHLIRATVKPLRNAGAAVPRPAAPARAAVAHHSIAPALYADLMSKPFTPGGRGPVSFDCVGLAVELAARQGRVLPAFVSSEAELHRQLGYEGATLADLPQIAHPVPGCIVLLRISGTEHHIGTMIDQYRMIHILRGSHVTIERINSTLWHRKVIGFYSLSGANEHRDYQD